MATAKTTKSGPATKITKASSTAKAASAPRPIKVAFNKTSLTAHLAEQAGVEPRSVKAVLAALEAALVAGA